ncbi:MAG TPA: OmpH family outer membrane protein, partial [Bacteroidales bacterium]
NRSEITRLEKELSKRGNDYKRYTDEIEKISKEENEKLTQGAFNQINSFIEKYSKENNIDIVIGVTLSGNVLYGADKMDITDKILEGLNKSYR